MSKPNPLKCPRCSCTRFIVWRTRHLNDKILRVRKCQRCGHPIRTAERIESNSA